MHVVIAALVASYLCGVYLVVSSLLRGGDWVEDDDGEMHQVPPQR